jgi:Ca-activated chloride channel family protein
MKQPSPQELHEARLTAYALDELSGAERAQVERLLAEDTPQAAAATREIALIRGVGTQLTRELARELGDAHAHALTPAQRAAISRAAKPARPRLLLRWSLATACAALAAILMVVVLVPGGAPESQVVAIRASSQSLQDAKEKDGRRFERAAPPATGKPRLLDEAAKQAAALDAPAVQAAPASDRAGGEQALAKASEPAVAGNLQVRKRDSSTDDHALLARTSPATPPMGAAGGAAPGAPAPGAVAGEQSVVADAAPAPLAAAPAVAPAPAPPAAPSVAAASPPASSAVAERQLPEAKKAMAEKGGRDGSAQGAPASAPRAAGDADGAVTGLAAAPRAAPTPILVDRLKSLGNGPAVEQNKAQVADKATVDSGNAVALVSAGAPASDAIGAASNDDDGMISTGLAAQVQIPLAASTQSLDSVRRCLDAGRLPPPALVQISELINAAATVQRQAPGSAPATIGISAGTCPWQTDHQLLGIVIAARTVVPAPRPALNLVVLVDGTAAMRGDDRLALIQSGLARLVQGLGSADRMSLVAYGAQARLVISGIGPADAAAAQAAVSGLSAAGDAGGADPAAGLALALQALHRSHPAGSSDALVLCTAGLPSVDQALADQLRRLAAEGVSLQVMAVGHDHPDAGELERIAALGHGSFTYLASVGQAEDAFAGIGAPREVVAWQALAEVAFDAAEIASYRLIGAQLTAARLAPAAASSSAGAAGTAAGELRAGQAMALLFEVARALPLAERRQLRDGTRSAAAAALISVRLSYRLAEGRAGVPISASLAGAGAAGQGPDQLSLIAAAAEFALALRHPGDPRFRWERMLGNAQAYRTSANADPLRSAGLIDLITRATALAVRGDGR